MTFVKMYVVHQHNLAQQDCVTRTRQLLDYITIGESKQDFLIWPYEQATIDSTKTILDLWEQGAIFDGYTKVKTDSSLWEHIEVSYSPRTGERDTLSAALHAAIIIVDWRRNTVAGAWRAALKIGEAVDSSS